jgi:hypothetical protein
MTQQSVDIGSTLAAKSDQLDAIELIHPRTIRVRAVTAGSKEQPINVWFDGDDDRPFRPSKTVRRLLCAAWGTNGADWVGRSMTIYNDPTVRYGGIEVGGVRVSHVSHISAPIKAMLPVTRGKFKEHVILPLKAEVRSVKPAERPPLDLAPPTESDAVLADLIRRMNEAADMDQLAAIGPDVAAAPLTDAQRDHARAVYLERRDALANQE